VPKLLGVKTRKEFDALPLAKIEKVLKRFREEA
jgi:hypothetical protein